MNEEKLLQEIEDLKQRLGQIESAKKTGAFRKFISRSFSKMNVLVGVGITVLVTSLIAYAAQITFQDGELIIAEDVNANFTELYDKTSDLELAGGQADASIAGLTDRVALLESTTVNPVAIRDKSRGLKIKNNDINTTSQVDVTADEIILEDNSFNPFRATNINLTLDMAITGVNGLDTGTEASSTWYHLWIISDGTNTAGLFSLSSTSPVMPSGYTYRAYAGAIYNNGSSHFITIYQSGNIVRCNYVTLVNGGSATTFSYLDLTGAVPITAKIVIGQMVASVGAASSYVVVTPSNSSNFAQCATWANVYGGSNFSLLVTVPQTMYYLVSNCLGTIHVSGWEY